MRFNERIEIQKQSVIQDDEGFDTKKWVTIHKCWSCFQAVRGNEFIEAKATQSLNIVTFTIKICNIIKNINTKDYRVFFKGKTYNIEYIYDLNDKHKIMDLKCNCIE